LGQTATPAAETLTPFPLLRPQFAASRCLNEITAVARLVLWASEKRRRRAAAAAARGGRLAQWAGGARELAGRVLASL
jgi:hypothetical protein